MGGLKMIEILTYIGFILWFIAGYYCGIVKERKKWIQKNEDINTKLFYFDEALNRIERKIDKL